MLLGSASLVAACNSDGRTLRPPRADQNVSISVPGTSTTTTRPPGLGTVPIATDDTLDPFSTDTDPGLTDTDPGLTDTDPGATDPSATDIGAVGDSADLGTVPFVAQIGAPWADGGPIPKDLTCDGANRSPALTWSKAPAGTVEIALTMTDDQAPGVVHWAVAGLPAASTAAAAGSIASSAIQATNVSGTVGYTGPCPPKGSTHTYRLTVHYLAQATELATGVAGADLLSAIEGSTFAQATVTGTYRRA
jgi:Raf kinase inhibitor-like YbhB/YbcL family protein